jgi:hypothetical protein
MPKQKPALAGGRLFLIARSIVGMVLDGLVAFNSLAVFAHHFSGQYGKGESLLDGA